MESCFSFQKSTKNVLVTFILHIFCFYDKPWVHLVYRALLPGIHRLPSKMGVQRVDPECKGGVLQVHGMVYGTAAREPTCCWVLR